MATDDECLMRIISKRRLDEAAALHPKVRATIAHWHAVVKVAVWRHLPDTRATFPHADQVAVRSNHTVTVFNLTNDFRLIAAIHYNRQTVFILRVLTHADYSRGDWQKEL